MLNALEVVNEAFKERGIKVPLESQATVTEKTVTRKGMKSKTHFEVLN